jgi:hypothetical protein
MCFRGFAASYRDTVRNFDQSHTLVVECRFFQQKTAAPRANPWIKRKEGAQKDAGDVPDAANVIPVPAPADFSVFDAQKQNNKNSRKRKGQQGRNGDKDDEEGQVGEDGQAVHHFRPQKGKKRPLPWNRRHQTATFSTMTTKKGRKG